MKAAAFALYYLLRVAAGLVGIAVIPLLAYGLFMVKAFGGFAIGGNNSIPVLETSLWVGGILLLLAFAFVGFPINLLFIKEQEVKEFEENALGGSKLKDQ